MSHSYFDRNRNLQINGDVNFISNGGSAQDNRTFFQVTQQVQEKIGHSRALEQGFKILCDNTAPSARYGHSHSFKSPQCHPGTRTAVQDYIFKWLDDPDGPIAMWMNGPVGIGKSAIAQTVAHLASERGQLSSAFFFFRSDDTRNKARYIVPTLAYEMTQQMPSTLGPLCKTIATNPLIFSESSPLIRQINDTLLDPFRSPSEPSSEPCRLIIIDGLDECHDINAQQAIIRSFTSCLIFMSTHIIPHKVLIVSRPESHIASTFSAANIRCDVKHLSLKAWDTEDDIEIFLRDKFDEIKETHPLRYYLPAKWPDRDSFRKLRRRSVGSFAYASAVMHSLASHKIHPERALQGILSLQPARETAAFAHLDALYRHILLGIDPEIRFTVQRIFCLHVYSFERYIPSIAARLLEEESTIATALSCVSSLVYLDGSEYMKFCHRSFEEFLRDKERSGDLYVFSPRIATAVAIALSNLWLQPINDGREYYWFQTIGNNLKYAHNTNIDMDAHILRTLAETHLPASFLCVKERHLLYAFQSINKFFLAIQWRSIQDSTSTYRHLYIQAFNVVCVSLRSHLNLIFQDRATLSDILDIMMENPYPQNDVAKTHCPAFFILRGLAVGHNNPFDILCRLVPEMCSGELCFGILEKYLALPTDARKSDVYRSCFGRTDSRISLHQLFCIALGQVDAIIPSFCQRLEQIVLDGKKALNHVPRHYITSKHCIFLSLYGEEYHFNCDNYLDIKPYHDDVWIHVKPLWRELIEKTDSYIYEVHAKLNFAYISEEVETLYNLEAGES